MCAILDAKVAHEVFGRSPTPAGKAFFDWIDTGKGKLIIGGKLIQELDGMGIAEWLEGALLGGNAIVVESSDVNRKAKVLDDRDACQSDDHHIIALAQISGARLLYSNDRRLRNDFKDRNLVDGPPGKIYSTLKSPQFTKAHKRLLGQRNICSG